MPTLATKSLSIGTAMDKRRKPIPLSSLSAPFKPEFCCELSCWIHDGENRAAQMPAAISAALSESDMDSGGPGFGGPGRTGAYSESESEFDAGT
jgi:hypothetical protein